MPPRLRPAFLLFLLAPAGAELLTGSAPPAEFFHPLGFVVLLLLYGNGALLVRELVHRWGAGWPSVLALGASYGILEEGLACKSFFDPNWMDLGRMGTYGRMGGVNWVWSINLTFFHAVISVAIPVLLVTCLCPERRNEAWVGRRAFRWMAALFAADALFMRFVLTPYRPPVGPSLLAAVAALLLFGLARRLPASLGAGRPVVPSARPRWFFLTGFAGMLAFFVLQAFVPGSRVPVAIAMAMVPLLAGLVWTLVRHMSRGFQAWGTSHRWALASGALAFWALLAPLQELDNHNRPDDTAGMAVAGLVAGLLLFLCRPARRERRPAAGTEGAPGTALHA